MVRISVAVDLCDLIEKRERFVETPLGDPQRGLQVQDHRLVSKGIAGRLRAGGPPRICKRTFMRFSLILAPKYP